MLQPRFIHYLAQIVLIQIFPIVKDVLVEMEGYNVTLDGLDYIQRDGEYGFHVDGDREYIFNVDWDFKDQLC